MSTIPGQFQISGQLQDTFEISGISGQLGRLQSSAPGISLTLHSTLNHAAITGHQCHAH